MGQKAKFDIFYVILVMPILIFDSSHWSLVIFPNIVEKRFHLSLVCVVIFINGRKFWTS